MSPARRGVTIIRVISPPFSKEPPYKGLTRVGQYISETTPSFVLNLVDHLLCEYVLPKNGTLRLVREKHNFRIDRLSPENHPRNVPFETVCCEILVISE